MKILEPFLSKILFMHDKFIETWQQITKQIWGFTKGISAIYTYEDWN